MGSSQLDAVAPISYAPRGGQLALALRGYKDEYFYSTRYHHPVRLAAMLERFLVDHEAHAAHASGVESFGVVAVVPSKTTDKDEARPGLRVGCVVIGRWLRPDFAGEWGNVRDIYSRLPKRFDWSTCAAEL